MAKKNNQQANSIVDTVNSFGQIALKYKARKDEENRNKKGQGYKNGGKITSKNKTKHRSKTTHGAHKGY